MNDDDLPEILALLRSEHRRLDDDIVRMRESGNCDQLELARLKKRKLRLKDLIERIVDSNVPDISA